MSNQVGFPSGTKAFAGCAAERKAYDKIVRDRIPEIIEASGRRAEFAIVDTQRAIDGLEAKLGEELDEYLADHSVEELADLVEVVRGILYHRGISWDELETVRQKKYAERGGFEKGIRLLGVEG